MRKIQWIRTILALAVVLSATSIVLFFNLSPSQRPLGANLDLGLFKKERDLQARLTGIYMIEEDEGKRAWELWADNAQVYGKGDNILLEKIKAFLYLDNAVKVQIRGQKGKINGKTKDMELTGQVIVVNNDGTSLLTDYLKWDAQKREMHSPSSVTVKGGGMEIKGEDMVTYLDSQTLVLKRDVEAVLEQW
ncbi:MAG: LPS export ABC transporter periplasmic protein LptC [Nitrospinae bacterium RIFCSPLOWO2_12_FULL_45_22]|nr:MAG: LPS export ABC transporter periplasmic protein LptC [Nitrospinae bacterium RIFCSPLOWO2_12_FULL_45_22]